jgi:cardiolipin synthase
MGIWIIVALVGGAVATLIALNLSSSERKIDHEVRPLYAAGDPQFVRSLGALLGPGIVGGNRVASFLNGDQIFPAMLDAIRSARRTITFETYIYWSGEIGRAFADALAGKRSMQDLARQLRHEAPQGTTEGSLFVPEGYLTIPLVQ